MKPETENDEKKRNFTRIAVVACALVIICLVTVLIGLSASGNLRGTDRVEQDLTSPVEGANKNETDIKDTISDTTDSSDENPVNIPDGLKTMPNLGFLLSGYDLMFGNPLPTSASGVLTSDPGFRLPIFASDFSKGQTTQDNRYLVPNGMSFRSCAGTCSLSFTSSLIEMPSNTVTSSASRPNLVSRPRGYSSVQSFQLPWIINVLNAEQVPKKKW